MLCSLITEILGDFRFLLVYLSFLNFCNEHELLDLKKNAHFLSTQTNDKSKSLSNRRRGQNSNVLKANEPRYVSPPPAEPGWHRAWETKTSSSVPVKGEAHSGVPGSWPGLDGNFCRRGVTFNLQDEPLGRSCGEPWKPSVTQTAIPGSFLKNPSNQE